MDKFTRITATACPLNVTNINTDQLLPARYLKWPRAAGLGKVLLQDLRFDSEGREQPDFPLNRPQWRDAKIIVAGRNFGCGSSREAAVYALYDYGIRCVIAPSFGDIFAGNAVQNGLLTAAVPDDVAAETHVAPDDDAGDARHRRPRTADHYMRQSQLRFHHRSGPATAAAQRLGRYRAHRKFFGPDRGIQSGGSHAPHVGVSV